MIPLHDRSHQLAGLLDAIPFAASVAHDCDANDVTSNAACRDILRRVLECEGSSLLPEATPLARAARGECVVALRVDVRRDDDSCRQLLCWAAPLHDGSGAGQGAACVFMDSFDPSAERRDSEPAASMPATRGGSSVEALLWAVSAVLSGLADVSFYDLRSAGGTMRRQVEVAAGIGAATVQLVQSLAPPRRAFREGHSFPRSVSRGETIHVERIDDAWLRDAAADDDVYAVWQRVGYHSLVSVPLGFADSALGRLTVLRTRNALPFGAIEVPVVEEIGRRIGFILDALST